MLKRRRPVPVSGIIWFGVIRPMRNEDYLQFVVEYEDGRVAFMSIDQNALLRRGDHYVRIAARERQEAGRLPRGKIAHVRQVSEDDEPAQGGGHRSDE